MSESGSAWIQDLFANGERLASASLGHVETVAALNRRLDERALAAVEPQLKADWRNMIRLQMAAETDETAAELARRYKLRGTDAVHLAAALTLHKALAEVDEVVLVASDRELLAAAQDAGLRVRDPAIG
jgi:predicted nucleic acid-binding protein